MRRAERLDGILARLASDGSVSVRELTESLGASSATIRRDLSLLEEQRLLSRSHGGAVGNGVLYELPVRYRGGQRAEDKGRIAVAAAERTAEAQTVGLTGGTTTTEVAQRFANHHQHTHTGLGVGRGRQVRGQCPEGDLARRR